MLNARHQIVVAYKTMCTVLARVVLRARDELITFISRVMQEHDMYDSNCSRPRR